ncbi:MAG: DUF3365 domain-containing protein [Woeseiaceae bacterium]
MNRVTLALCCCFVLAASSIATNVVAANDTAAARGVELLKPFKTSLKRALLAGLEDGPENAISACKDQAPAIAQSLSTDDVKVGRTSHRLRNPANKSPDWVTAVLEAYLSEDSDREPTIVPLADSRLGYVEPIVMQPLCLSCHGAVLASGVAVRIKEEYPYDEAVGFEVGDLRGVFWAEFPDPDTH